MKTKKTPRRKLAKKALELWAKIIRLKGSCEICGKTNFLVAHHIVGKRNLRLRYDLRNGVCLCAGCHTMKRESAHQDQVWFHFWLINNRSNDWNYIVENREKLVFNVDYEEIIDKLSKIYKLKLGSESSGGVLGGEQGRVEE